MKKITVQSSPHDIEKTFAEGKSVLTAELKTKWKKRPPPP